MTTDNHDQALEARAVELLHRMQKAKSNERGHWCDARAAVDAACDILPKIIAALREARVPEGFVLVPVEPTPEMLRAPTKIVCGHRQETIAKMYRAMLAAAKDGRP